MTRPSFFYRSRAAIRSGLQTHGIKFPFVAIHRFGVYSWRKKFGPRSFSLSGESHGYMIHPFILNNERVVEVALARDFLVGHAGNVLEVGNVLGNFMAFPREVVDKYEIAPGVINEDIVTFSPTKKYDAIVTLSTLEHVGWDETPRTPEKILVAIERLKSLLAQGGELLATMPIDYNSYLDQVIRENRTGFSDVKFLIRTSANNQWREAALEEALSKKFGSPFSCANAIFIGRYRQPRT